MRIIDEFNDFIANNVNNRWIAGNGLKIYCRKGQRSLGEGQTVPTLELANVTVGDGTREKTGRLRLIFAAMEAQPLFEYLYVENCNPRMQEICLKNGYAEIPRSVNDRWIFSPSFIKKINRP